MEMTEIVQNEGEHITNEGNKANTDVIALFYILSH